MSRGAKTPKSNIQAPSSSVKSTTDDRKKFQISSSNRQKGINGSALSTLLYGCGFILLLTLLVYWPALQGGFVWDDDSMLTDNAAIKSPHGLYYIWRSTALPDYFPLTSTTLWAEWRLWGMHAWGYHLTNVLLHAFSAMVIWRVLHRLGIMGAWVIAVIFAAHPVNVESVAWITERKNTLAMLFYALAWYAFLRSQETGDGRQEERKTPNSKLQTQKTEGKRNGTRWYWISVVFFLLALLSKTAVVMFPFVLLLFAWWRRGRIDAGDVRRSVPFFALLLGLGLVTMWFQSYRAIAGDEMQSADFWTHLAGAGWALWFYLFKAVLPVNLSFVYPDWDGGARSVLSWIPLAGAVVTFAALFRWRKSSGRHVLFALGYFVLMLFPVLGFVNVYFHRYSLVADHWQYFSLPAIIALVVGGACAAGLRIVEGMKGPNARIGDGAPRQGTRLATARVSAAGPLSWIAWPAAALCIAALSALSFQQAQSYAGPERLWTETLRKNPRAWMAHNNLGQVLASQRRFDEAMEHYAAGLRIKPEQAEGHNNLGSVLMDLGRLDEAAEQFQAALRVDPRFGTAIYNLGNVADHRGNRSEAMKAYRRALELNPEYPEAHNNLGCLLAAQEDLGGAVQHFREALRWKPNYPDACNNLGSTLTEQGKWLEAQPFLRRAIELDPNYADAHYNLGNALLFSGHTAEAKAEYSKALQLKPYFVEAHLKMGSLCLQERDFDQALANFSMMLKLRPDSVDAHYHLGVLFSATKQFGPAIDHYRQALRANPDWPEALNSLAWIYATANDERLRDGREAVRMASRAAELTGRKDAGALDTLAAAEAESGHFALAISTAQLAADLAADAGQKDGERQIRTRLETYRQNKPWRD